MRWCGQAASGTGDSKGVIVGYPIHSQKRAVQGAVLGLFVLLSGCSSHDEDVFPYRMRGLNAYLYDLDADREIYLGFMEASYRNREQTLAQCQNAAWS